jgi:hypothetical protein
MISMPLEFKRMRFDGKSTPLMLTLTAGHISLVLISPPTELTRMVCFMFAIGRLCFATKLDVMNECDALESNKIDAGCELDVMNE